MTDCVFSTPLADEALIVYLDDPTDLTVAEHLQACPACAHRAQQWQRAHTQLARTLERADCIEPLALGEYHLNLLSPEHRRKFEQHLQHCPHCQQELKLTQEFLGPTAAPSHPATLRELLATLLGPSAAVANLRGTLAGPQIYQAEEYQIALEAGPNQIQGTLMSAKAENWKLELWQGPELAHAARLDEFGGFFAENLPTGSYALRLTSPDGSEIIHFPPLEL